MLAIIEEQQLPENTSSPPVAEMSHLPTSKEKSTPPSSPSSLARIQAPSMTLGVTNPSSFCGNVAPPPIVTPTSDDYQKTAIVMISPSVPVATKTPSVVESYEKMDLAPKPQPMTTISVLPSGAQGRGAVVPPPPPLVPASPIPCSNSELNMNSSSILNGTPLLPMGGVTSMPKVEPKKIIGMTGTVASTNATIRLNKFVRRLHDMLQSEQDSGIVEWRRGLLVLHSTDAFATKILPKYFNTRNFKTFRRQLNYYGFVHVRSFSATGSTTTALWVNQDLAKRGTKSISSVLMLKRVEPCESAKTAEGRRVRKEEAVNTVENIGISTRALQLEQIRGLTLQRAGEDTCNSPSVNTSGNQLNSNIGPSPHQIPLFIKKEPFSSVPLMPRSSSTLAWQCSQDLPPASEEVKMSIPAETAHHESGQTCDASADDAAKLLLMLSKPVVQSRPSIQS